MKTKQIPETYVRCRECGTVDKLRKVSSGWEVIRHTVDGRFDGKVCGSSNTDNYDPESAQTRTAEYGSF